MEVEQLNAILADKSDSLIEAEITSPSTDGQYICETCGKPFKTDLARRGHMQTHVGRYPKKEKEISTSGSGSGKIKDDNAIPTIYDRLENLLKGYGVKGVAGIMQSANMYEIDMMAFVPILKDLLRNTGTTPGLIGNIADAWSLIIGVKPEPTNAIIPEIKPSPLRETINMIQETIQLQALQNMAGNNNGNKSNPEIEAVKIQLLKMEEHNKKLEELLLKQRQEAEMQLIRDELKKTQEDNKASLGSLTNGLDEFITSFTHREELKAQEDKFTKQVQELKEELRLNNSKPLQEKMLDKIDGTLNNLGAGFAEMNKHTIQANSAIERGDRAMALINAGVPVNDIASILGGNTPQRPNLTGSSQMEWEKLKRMTQREPKVETPIEEIKPIEPELKKPDDGIETIKFNATE
jgi:hypothetical protein